MELPAVRRTQPITIGQNFFNNPMSNCYNGYMLNNNNNIPVYAEIQQRILVPGANGCTRNSFPPPPGLLAASPPRHAVGGHQTRI